MLPFLGPLPTLAPYLEDNSKPSGDVKSAGSTVKSPIVSDTTVDLTVSQTANSKQDASTNVTAQREKSSVASGALIPAKTPATAPAAPLKNDAKLENQATPVQPISKGPHGKGGFVHTLTANDGTKAQVYLSKSGAHAGIVFRNEISRGKCSIL